MRYRFYIDEAHFCVFVRFFGEVDHDEIKAQAAELVNSPGYTKNMNTLRDLTHATLLIGNDLESLKRLIATRSDSLDESIGSQRLSAWVLGDVQDFQKIHRFCALSRISHSIIDRQPFRDLDRALKWLGLPEDYEMAFE